MIYIDGVRWFEGQDETGSADAQSTTSLGGIEASDIEKISIVRGTKAVITYGPDAENGVILITLKDSVSKRESPR